ncbi:MAG: hypothetical protein WAQ98_06190 [Blastocatellia bacterium]
MTATKEQISEFLSRINYSEEKLLKELKKSGRKSINIVLGLSSVNEIERVYGSSSVVSRNSLRA